MSPNRPRERLVLFPELAQRQKKLAERSPPKGRLTTRRDVWSDQYQYLVDLLDSRIPDWNEGHAVFLNHLVQSRAGFPGRRPVPVEYKLLLPLLPDGAPGSGRSAEPVYQPLVDAKIVVRTAPDWARSRSAEYALAPEVVEGLVARSLPGSATAASERRDLVTGRATTSVLKSRTSRRPPIVAAAMRALDRGLFSDGPVRVHLRDLESRRDAAEAAWAAAGRRGRPSALAVAYDEARGRYENDRAAFDAVLRQDVQSTEMADVFSYRLAYSVASTGRLIQKRKGLQGASRSMKAAAYSGVEGARNYDLRACHVNLLVALLEAQGLDADWFAEFASSKAVRLRWAVEAGLPEPAFKKSVLALVNGARFPSKIDRSTGALGDVVRDHNDPEDWDDVWCALRDVVRPGLKPLKAWHRYLEDGGFFRDHGTNGRSGRSVANAVGARLVQKDLPKGQVVETIAPFVLQGLESAVVHRLAAFGADYGYRPISHEHDGLVTVGEVPDEAVERAKAEAGVSRAHLLLKPICSPEAAARLQGLGIAVRV